MIYATFMGKLSKTFNVKSALTIVTLGFLFIVGQTPNFSNTETLRDII